MQATTETSLLGIRRAQKDVAATTQEGTGTMKSCKYAVDHGVWIPRTRWQELIIAKREDTFFSWEAPPFSHHLSRQLAIDGSRGFTGLAWLGLGSGGEPVHSPGGPHAPRGSQSAGIISPWRDWLAQQRLRSRTCSGDPNLTFAQKSGDPFRGCPMPGPL